MDTLQTSTSAVKKRKPKTWWQRMKMRPFFIRWSNWEYYPSWLVLIPTVIYWLYLSVRARALGWFSATNPAIYTGGLAGESKDDIHRIIPPDNMPTNILVCEYTPVEAVLEEMNRAGLTFPVIAKPDIGARGSGVRKIKNREELEQYNRRCGAARYHVQEYLDLPVEAAVMYYRMPNSDEHGILSITLKKFLSVTGDGVSTFLELVEDNPRAILAMERVQQRYGHRFKEVLPKGETIELEPVGNHCRGTMFVSGMHLLNEEMVEGFRKITDQIDGLYFCRYDLRCPSIEDLQHGTNIKIMEINGVGADPTHIYDPAIGVFKKYRDIFRQWKTMYRIAVENHRKGVPYMGFTQLRQAMRQHKAALSKIED